MCVCVCVCACACVTDMYTYTHTHLGAAERICVTDAKNTGENNTKDARGEKKRKNISALSALPKRLGM